MTSIGFTGTREQPLLHQWETLAETLRGYDNVTEAHHGACVGADSAFHIAIRAMCPGAILHVHPPTNLDQASLWTMEDADVLHIGRPYLDRNRDIVDACDELIAVPSGPEVLRSGTWSTVRYARKVAGLVTIVILP